MRWQWQSSSRAGLGLIIMSDQENTVKNLVDSERTKLPEGIETDQNIEKTAGNLWD